MPALTKFFKDKRARRTAAGSLNASAHMPSPGTASSDNSLGASAGSAEIISYLENAFDELDAEGKRNLTQCFEGLFVDPRLVDFRSQKQFLERQICEKVEQYNNAGLASGIGSEWKP